MSTLKIKQIIKLTTLGIFIPLLFGCSSHLSRDEAEKAIKAKENLPNNDVRDFDFTKIVTIAEWIPADAKGYPTEYVPKKLPFFVKLENEGLITYSIERTDWWVDRSTTGIIFVKPSKENFVRGAFSHNGKLTEKGRQYAGNDWVKVATIEFEGITGIAERDGLNIAEVKYQLKRTNITPFGKLLGVQEEIFNRTATFTKYDDGWRIN